MNYFADCARDRFVFNAENIPQSIECEISSGSYPEYQVRNGFSFCVDMDGVRMGPLVNKPFWLLALFQTKILYLSDFIRNKIDSFLW